MVIDPELGFSNPAINRINVLFPHPDGPIITVKTPGVISSEQSLITSL